MLARPSRNRLEWKTIEKMKGTSRIKDTMKSIIPDDILTHRLDRRAARSVLLTFDDGPDERITPMVLNRLEEFGARAVFFVVGHKVEALPRLLDLIKEKGHIIGNHSYQHPKGTLPGLLEVLPYRRDIIKCQTVIEETIGVKPTLFRPPRGIAAASLLAAKSIGLKTVLYSNEGGEWGCRKSSDAETIGTVLSRTLRPRDIILLHDDNSKVPAILDRIMPVIDEQHLDIRNGVDYLM
jgi:peptidoglycan/xylan/chitin deacetylase (PgdA/CDA1 family)